MYKPLLSSISLHLRNNSERKQALWFGCIQRCTKTSTANPRGLTLWYVLRGWVNKDSYQSSAHIICTHTHTRFYDRHPAARLFWFSGLHFLCFFTNWRQSKWAVRGFARGKICIRPPPLPPSPLFFPAWQRNNRSTIQDFHLYSDKGYLGNLVLAISHYGESYEAEIKLCSQWLRGEGRWKL